MWLCGAVFIQTCVCVIRCTSHECAPVRILCVILLGNKLTCVQRGWVCVCLFSGSEKKKKKTRHIKCQPHECLSALFDVIFHFLRAPAADTLVIRSFVKPGCDTLSVCLPILSLPRCPTSLLPTPTCTRELSPEKALANLVSRDWVSEWSTWSQKPVTEWSPGKILFFFGFLFEKKMSLEMYVMSLSSYSIHCGGFHLSVQCKYSLGSCVCEASKRQTQMTSVYTNHTLTFINS